MRRNLLKAKLAEGKAVWGVMVTFPSPPVLEMLGYLGFESAEECVRACEVAGLTPVVRPIANRPDAITPFLDRGCTGVQVPHVNTAAEARAVVEAVKFAPQGHRGMFFRARPNDYGFASSPAEYVEAANRETLVVAMVEEVEGVRNAGAIAAVEGVDVVFVGTGDLSQALGYPGQQTHPEVLRLAEEAIAAVRGAGKVAGVSCPEDHIPHFLERGVQFFHSSVQQLLLAAGRDHLSRVTAWAKQAGRG